MKLKILLILFSLGFLAAMAIPFNKIRSSQDIGSSHNIKSSSNEEPWKPSQLLAPADLVKVISDPKAKQPTIICIGPGAVIKGSIDIGPAKDSSNLDKLRQQLSKLPQDAMIVIYCGCCPFEHCPNIRPAFTMLNEMKFTNPRLLNLEHNIKIDWINKGYPVI